MKPEGRIYIDKDRIFVDAEPHVMSRIRNIFDNAQGSWEQGQYTHKPIHFPINLTTCRDIEWVRDRYVLEISAEDLSLIQSKSNEHIKLMEKMSSLDKDPILRLSPDDLVPSIELRPHQVKFLNMFKAVGGRILLADKLGLGKTFSALSTLASKEARPALIVVPTHLCSQWEREVKRIFPTVSTHIIKGFKTYDLPVVDVIVTSYNRLAPWQDVLLKGAPFKTLILDEVQEVRHSSSGKSQMCRNLSSRVEYCVGLSGTPIVNYGSEIFSVMNTIKPACLGTFGDFESEWCSWGRVYEPATLNRFLTTQGLMLRRAPEDVGLSFGKPSKHVYTIDTDLSELEKVQNVAKMLALSVLSGNVGEESESARELDWKLRHATGVAKAKPVVEFVKMLLEQEEKVVLVGWHRDVYDIWMKDLAQFKPVMYTGSESSAEKDKAVKSFLEGDSKVFIISLRSGAGLDGLQRVCNNVVFGELDWSGAIMDQVVGRLDRDGQTKHVNAYYLTITDGADPFMLKVLNIKRSQHEGVVEGKEEDVAVKESESLGAERVREMAKAYLESIGEAIPESVPETGLMGEVAAFTRQLRLPTNSEDEMQRGMFRVLSEAFPETQREYRLSKRSRLDFLIERGDERVAIECKIDSTKRAEVYRQVRKYVEEGKITALILVAPWSGVASFKVDGVPVIVVDTSANSV